MVFINLCHQTDKSKWDGYTGNKPRWFLEGTTLRQKQSTMGKQSPGRVHSADCGQQGGEPKQSSAEPPLCVPRLLQAPSASFCFQIPLQNLLKG